MFRQLLVLALAPVGLFAFSESHPIVAWSSVQSHALDSVSAQHQLVQSSAGVLDAIASTEVVCNYESIVVVEQPGLHAADLRTLPSDSYVAQQLRSAPSSVHIPYSYPSAPLRLAQSIAALCRHKLLELDLGKVDVSLEYRVASISLPELHGSVRDRRQAMIQLESTLSPQLVELTSHVPSHLVIIVGTQPSSFTKRHLPAEEDSPVPAAFSEAVKPASDSRLRSPKGGIFKRYQLLTPGLITILIIVFGLLAPLLFFVISALATIKSPLRSETFKAPTVEKKTQ